MASISAIYRLYPQSDNIFAHPIHALTRMRMDVNSVMGTTRLRWWTPLTPTEKRIRSGSIETMIMLRTTLVTVRIFKMKNMILMTVKLPTMYLNTATKERSLMLLMMGQSRMKVQCQRMPTLCRYRSWIRRRGPIPLGPYCLYWGDKVYLGGFTNEYCTNCDKYEVSGSSHLESCENATGKEID